MNIITKQISELKPYENNPKIHTDRQIEQIAKSIELTKGFAKRKEKAGSKKERRLETYED